MTDSDTRGTLSALLDELDCRLAAALQLDGRASWATIAAALGEQERTVARRGSRLLQEGVVRVTGLSMPGLGVLVRVSCRPGMVWSVAAALTARTDTTFVYALTGASECIAEVLCPSVRLPRLIYDELPGLAGSGSQVALPVLEYFRTVRGWQPAVLHEREVENIVQGARREIEPDDEFAPVDAADTAILRSLEEDGRKTLEEIARFAGVSVSTARRRVTELRASGILSIRAVVDPAAFGLNLEALLWIQVAPRDLHETAKRLTDHPEVRYAVAAGGAHQLIADLVVKDIAAFRAFVTGASWSERVMSIESSLVVSVFKRSGLATDAG